MHKLSIFIIAPLALLTSGLRVAFQSAEYSWNREVSPILSIDYGFDRGLEDLAGSGHDPSKYRFLDNMTFEAEPSGYALDYGGTTTDFRMKSLYSKMREKTADVYVTSREDCRLMAEAASVRAVTLIAYNCDNFDPGLDGSRYPTLLSLVPPIRSQVDALANILDSLKIDNVVILYTEGYLMRGQNFNFTLKVGADDSGPAEQAKRLLEEKGVQISAILPVRYYVFGPVYNADAASGSLIYNIAESIMQTYITTRVYVTLGRPSGSSYHYQLDKMVTQQLTRMGLMQTGEYTVLSMQNPTEYFSYSPIKKDMETILAARFINRDILADAGFAVTPDTSMYYYDGYDNFKPGLLNCMFLAPKVATANVSLNQQLYKNIVKLSGLSDQVLATAYGLDRHARSLVIEGFLRRFYGDVKTKSPPPQMTHHVRLIDAIGIIIKSAVEIADATQEDPFVNATRLAQWFRGRSTAGFMGPVTFDEAGSVKATFEILRFPPDSDEAVALVDTDLNRTDLEELWKDFPWLTAPPMNRPRCGYFGQDCPAKVLDRNIPFLAIGAGCAVALLLLSAIAVYRMYKQEMDLLNLNWIIPRNQLQLRETLSGISRTGSLSILSFTSTHSLAISTADIQAFERNLLEDAAKSKRKKLPDDRDPWADFEHSAVAVRDKQIVLLAQVHKDRIMVTRNVRKELKQMIGMSHVNICEFYGCVYEPPLIALVSEFCSRGSLQDIVDDDVITLDHLFYASIVFDIIKGMEYLIKSPIKFHGRLKSNNCMVDSRWQVKLSGFGLWEFRQGESDPFDAERGAKEKLWTAPELLRKEKQSVEQDVMGNIEGDAWSFGIILHELFGRSGIFGSYDLNPFDVLERLMHPQEELYRPDMSVLHETPKAVLRTIETCLAEAPQDRPSFGLIKRMLKPIKKGLKSDIVDNMVEILERYTNNLEDVVEERTQLLQVERKRSERLLLQLLPAQIAEQLKMGNSVDAENHQAVTIYFSDIVGFTSLSSQSTPLQIVAFLNDLYTLFDSVSDRYDVYKVETIGDAYMAVSGMPMGNGDNHAGEITSMALSFLEGLERFEVRHMPNYKLRLRIGLHTGPCVSGVVGVRMPRYCLFGETVNTAAKMESSGEAMRIHASQPCHRILTKLGGYKISDRGMTDIWNNKKPQMTYWVTGEDQPARMRRLSEAIAVYPHLKKFAA